jgi:SSS family solute:Na+ symporter
MLGAYTRWFNSWALLAGWAVGTYAGTAMAYANKLGATYPLHAFGHTFPGYIALYTVVLNLAVALVLTPVFNAIASDRARDATQMADYAE